MACKNEYYLQIEKILALIEDPDERKKLLVDLLLINEQAVTEERRTFCDYADDQPMPFQPVRLS